MDVNQALVKNAISTPFNASNPDGTETGIDECMLFYIRQQRLPTGSSSFDASAGLFQRAFGEDKQEAWAEKFRFQCEQYLARVELLGKLVAMEAGLRQLVRSHLTKKAPQVVTEELRREKKNLIEALLNLCQRLVNDECDQFSTSSFPRDSFNLLIERLRSFYVAPLVVFRNGLCHGNIRAYVRDLIRQNPAVGPISNNSADGRAIQIYENLDAVSYYFLQKNLNIVHHVTYEWLVDYMPGQLIEKILSDARFEHQIYSQQGISLTCHRERSLLKHLDDISDPCLKDACVVPFQSWIEFLSAFV